MWLELHLIVFDLFNYLFVLFVFFPPKKYYIFS